METIGPTFSSGPLYSSNRFKCEYHRVCVSSLCFTVFLLMCTRACVCFAPSLVSNALISHSLFVLSLVPAPVGRRTPHSRKHNGWRRWRMVIFFISVEITEIGQVPHGERERGREGGIERQMRRRRRSSDEAKGGNNGKDNSSNNNREF